MTTTTSPVTAVGLPAPWADRTGRILLALCALSTLVAFADGVRRVIDSPDMYVMTEFWRTAAYIVFAGMWAPLALAPRRQRGMWELILIHKVAVTLFAIALIDKPGAPQTAVIDATVASATVVAYVLCRGWYTWRRTEAPANARP